MVLLIFGMSHAYAQKFSHKVGLQVSYTNQKFEGDGGSQQITIPRVGVKYQGTYSISERFGVSVYPSIEILPIPLLFSGYQYGFQIPIAFEYDLPQIKDENLRLGLGLNCTDTPDFSIEENLLNPNIYNMGLQLSLVGEFPARNGAFGFRVSYMIGLNDVGEIKYAYDEYYTENTQVRFAFYYLF